MLDDGKAQARPAGLAAAGDIHPEKALKNPGSGLGGDARAMVLHRKLHLPVFPGLGIDPNPAFAGGILDGVVQQIFDDVAKVKTDPEMVQLAKQLIDRQTAKYDPSDIVDRYETRLREMIDAKLKGEGINLSEPAEPDRTNVIDLMASMEKSLGEPTAKPQQPAAKEASKPATKPKRAAAAQAAKPSRKRA